MEPRIQYARTSDGVAIAWWALGDGPVLISSSLPGSHIDLEWQTPALRAIYEQAAQAWRFVRFDHRGCGLSDREAADFSLDAMVRDMEAVIERLGAPQVQLMATALAGPVALACAAAHPDRVSHLVLVDVVGIGGPTPPRLATLRDLAAADWEFTAQALTRAFVGWNDEAAARESGSLFARSILPAQLVAITDASADWGLDALLPRVAARTLVVQHATHPFYDATATRRLAAAIPDAQLALLNEPLTAFLEPAAVAAIGQFLLDVPPETVQSRSAVASSPARARTAVVLFADIVDSTALTETMGDAAFQARADRLHATLRDLVRRHGGRPLEGKLLGDGVVAVFEAARDAIAAALECAAHGDTDGLPLHVGVHAGDVLETSDNVHGGAVNAAARIAAMAPPGEVLVSDVVRGLARTSTTATFEDRGTHALRGIAEPQQVFRVRPVPTAK